ncbi:MAG: hypothetical protein V1767_00840 [Chloroflexota bacterium]
MARLRTRQNGCNRARTGSQAARMGAVGGCRVAEKRNLKGKDLM